MQKAGAELKSVRLPSFEFAAPAYYALTCAEASSNLSRYDGVRYGRRAKGEDLRAMYENSRAEGFGGEVKRRILVGAYVLSAGYYDAYYRRAAKVRQLIARDFATVFESCDIVAGPAAPGPAFALGSIADDDPVAMYMQDIYTVAGEFGRFACGVGAVRLCRQHAGWNATDCAAIERSPAAYGRRINIKRFPIFTGACRRCRRRNEEIAMTWETGDWLGEFMSNWRQRAKFFRQRRRGIARSPTGRCAKWTAACPARYRC